MEEHEMSLVGGPTKEMAAQVCSFCGATIFFIHHISSLALLYLGGFVPVG